MSERRSINGAEDMLASIRRLVADEVRAGSEPVVPSSARLLLTPALRVEPGQLPPKRSEKIRPLRIVLNERRAALAAHGGQVPLLLSEEYAVTPEVEAEPREASPSTLRLVSPLPEVVSEPQANSETTAEPELGQGSDFLARLAELEMLLDAQEQPYELDDPQLEEGIAPWLTSHAGALSGVPFIDLGLGETSTPEPVAPQVAASAVETPASAAPADDSALRAVIRDVLREELEGPMGERVTRNLRKLIRSELARAFASRGLG